MTSFTSPLRPHDDLDQVKRQAKELLRSFRAGDADVVAVVQRHYRDSDPVTFALSDAQLVVARAAGFASWPKLKAFVEARMRARSKAIGAPFDAHVVKTARPLQIGWVEPDGANDPAGGGEHTVGGTTIGGAADFGELSRAVDVPPSRVWFVEPRTDLPGGDWAGVVDEMRQRRIPGLITRGRANDDDLRLIGTLDHLVYLDLSHSPTITDAGLAHLAGLTRLEYLGLRHCERITDAGLAVLASMPNLRVVRLDRNEQFTDAGVRPLQHHAHLELVTLGDTACGDGAIATLAGKTELANLTLGTKTTDAGLAMLLQFPALTTWRDDRPLHKIDAYRGPDTGYLGVAGEAISDAGLRHLETLEGVTRLSLDSFYDRSTLITEAASLSVTAMPNLLGFDLPGRLVTDAFVARVPQMRRITSLSFWDAAATDAGMLQLAKADQITGLFMGKFHNLTPRGLATLAAMPNLNEMWLGSRNLPDAGLACLKDFHSLRKFATANENIFTDEAFHHIARIPHLEHLTNMYVRTYKDNKLVTATTDRSTHYLTQARHLKGYSIWGSFIGDASMAMLAAMPTLEDLLFYRCENITDAGIRQLARLPKLRKLDLQNNPHVTAAALSAFDRSVQVNFQPPT